MARDYYGYVKDAKGPGNVVSPTMVVVAIDGDKLRLAQSATVNYRREVQPTYELGSDSVWMVAGKTSGSCELSRAIGNADSSSGQMLQPYRPDSACDTQTIMITKGDGHCGMDPGTIYCGGCLLSNVGVTVNVGSLTLTDSASYTVGSVSLS